jgi:hypothetical protein
MKNCYYVLIKQKKRNWKTRHTHTTHLWVLCMRTLLLVLLAARCLSPRLCREWLLPLPPAACSAVCARRLVAVSASLSLSLLRPCASSGTWAAVLALLPCSGVITAEPRAPRGHDQGDAKRPLSRPHCVGPAAAVATDHRLVVTFACLRCPIALLLRPRALVSCALVVSLQPPLPFLMPGAQSFPLQLLAAAGR